MSERFESLQNWLIKTLKTSDFNLKPASEDASFRYYYRLSLDHKSYIVMDAPPEQEDCQPFVKVNRILNECRVNVPIIHNMDLAQGFLLLSDFGNDHYLNKLDQTNANQLYSEAIKTIVSMQLDADTNQLDAYDSSLLQREMYLFTDWLLAKHLKIELNDGQTKAIETLFNLLEQNALEQPQAFVHRDFHSRNLMLTKANNPGVIDFQDAVLGPVSYDLMSLLKDCYIKWSQDEINHWVDFYLNERLVRDAGLNIGRDQFQRWFDLMGVQRHLKASGIFARLSHRDGKHGFLKDVPRTLSYILDLKQTYQELAPLCQLIENQVLPKLEGA
jgi:aminoglycoside/choline kinase family phosphotransferase